LRDFAAYSDGASPADVSVVFSLFILDCMVMYIILLLFCLFCDFLILFI
jgi:Na+/H+ antiporter NhaC